MTDDQAMATAEPIDARIDALAATAVATASNPPRLTGPRVIDNELIASIATAQCGWSKRQLQLLGVGWPPPSGWRQRLVAEGRSLTGEEVEALFAARKTKRTAEGDPAEIPVLPCPWCSRPVQRVEQGGRTKEFCNKKHKTAFNNSLTKLSIATARLMWTPGALRTWAEGGVNPSPSGAEGSPQVTARAGHLDAPSAPPRDEVQ